MEQYPRRARCAEIKCIECNAPVVRTTDEGYVCVDCGTSPVRADDRPVATVDDD